MAFHDFRTLLGLIRHDRRLVAALLLTAAIAAILALTGRLQWLEGGAPMGTQMRAVALVLACIAVTYGASVLWRSRARRSSGDGHGTARPVVERRSDRRWFRR